MRRHGGKAGDFEPGPGAHFARQHDAGWRPDGTPSLFDSQAASSELVESDQSRGMIILLDEQAGSATLVRQFTHPAGLLAPSQGNLQDLPSGHVLVGWGVAAAGIPVDDEGPWSMVRGLDANGAVIGSSAPVWVTACAGPRQDPRLQRHDMARP